MTNDEFLCAELGIIGQADIDAYSPSDFQREYLAMLADGVKSDCSKLRMMLLELASNAGMVPRDDRGNAVDDVETLYCPSHIQLAIDIGQARYNGKKARETANDGLQRVLYPAFELVQNVFHLPDIEFYLKDIERRWTVAGNACSWEGVVKIEGQESRKVATIDSPIWKMLGNANLFDDGLEIDFPPFFVNGGWVFGWKRVSKRELEKHANG